jgi:hypothetical protein
MLKHNLAKLAIMAAVFCGLRTSAQIVPQSGLFEILSGTYSECCGIIGTDTFYPLPDSGQTYVGLTVDSQTSLATMTFLGADRQTVFSRVPCPAAGSINFDFSYGFASSSGVFFHVDPGPPPYEMYWGYTASNSAGMLRVDGMVGISSAGCADTTTHFTHSNLLAVLVPPPRLTALGVSTNNAPQLMIQGRAGHTNLLQASWDLKVWTAISTNVMDYSACPICPFAIVEDIQSTNFLHRFYRASEL